MACGCIRRMTIDDAAFLFRQLTQPSWLQYIGDRGVRSAEDAERYIQSKTLEQYRTLGYGMNLVQLKSTGEPMRSWSMRGGCLEFRTFWQLRPLPMSGPEMF